MPSSKDFYHYNGSLTTPNCTEVVSWVVYKNTLNVTSAAVSLNIHNVTGKMKVKVKWHFYTVITNFMRVKINPLNSASKGKQIRFELSEIIGTRQIGTKDLER